MVADFPRILTLLRKEKGVSQKQAAADLKVSQALLSHYEKGIRECGLDFVVRAADYYEVSCDYLLGRSPERTGAKISFEDIPEADAMGKENRLNGSILPTLNKKLIANSLNIVFDMLASIDNKELTSEVSTFLNLSVYRMFRIIYGASPKNSPALFTVSPVMAKAKALALMATSEAKASVALEAVKAEKEELSDKLHISTESLSTDYPLFASSLLNLIKNSENALNK